MAFDAAASLAILKNTFTPKRINTLAPKGAQFALWNILDKKQKDAQKGAFGYKFIIPMKLNHSQAVGSSIAASETKAAAASGSGGEAEYKAFEVQAVAYYGTAVVDGVTALKADGNDNGSFIDALAESTKDVMESLARRYAIYAHGTGQANLGRIKAATTPTATTIQVRAGDRKKIRKGMTLVAAATLTGALRSATGLTVNGTKSDGTLTLSGNPVTLGWVAGDYLFAKDDRGLVITGLAGYNPVTEPSTSTLVHGVDISTQWELSGMRVDAAAHADALTGLQALAVEMDTVPTHAVCNTETWTLITALLPDKNVYKTGVTDASIGYDTVKVVGPWGSFELVADPAAEPGEVRVFNKEHLFWAYAGPSIFHPIDEDGNAIRKIAGTDSFGMGIRSVAALCCDNPASLGVLYGVA